MEFDDRLSEAFDQLSARLGVEIARELSAARAQLSTIIGADRTRAIAEAMSAGQTVVERQSSERIAGAAAAENLARTQMESGESAAITRLFDAIRAIDRGQSLSEIMDVLAVNAGAVAPRAAIVLPADAAFYVWRLIGFDQLLDQTVEIELAVEEAGIIADAAETGSAARAGDSAWAGLTDSSAPSFASLPQDRPALAVPLVMSGHVFAVLYADQGPSGEVARESWAATLEILARHAARSLEAVTAGRVAQLAEMNSARS